MSRRNDISLASDRETADRIIQKFSGHIEEISYIDHGYHNLVVCVNRHFVFRFPRSKDAARRLRLEAALLQDLKGKVTAIPIPEVIRVSGEPLYLVLQYLQGECLSARQIQQLSDAEQVALGRSLAQFIVQFSRAIDSERLIRFRRESGVQDIDESWTDYFKRVFVDQRLPNDKLRPIVDEYYPLWKDCAAAETATYAVHDDLHQANILFLGPTLSGVIDFGVVSVGSIEQAMRGLYRLGDTILNAALQRYQELTGKAIDKEHVRVWAITGELASFTYHLGAEHTNHPSLLRAHANLRDWLPGFPV